MKIVEYSEYLLLKSELSWNSYNEQPFQSTILSIYTYLPILDSFSKWNSTKKSYDNFAYFTFVIKV